MRIEAALPALRRLSDLVGEIVSDLPMTAEPILHGDDVAAVDVVDLRYAFGDVRAVDGVTFSVGSGEVFGLLGPNGAGKTTTIRMITTLLRPAGGRIEVFGTDVVRSPMQVRRLLGYVPQQLSIDGQLTGYENVTLFARLFDVPRRERRARVARGAAASWGSTVSATAWRRRTRVA